MRRWIALFVAAGLFFGACSTTARRPQGSTRATHSPGEAALAEPGALASEASGSSASSSAAPKRPSARGSAVAPGVSGPAGGGVAGVPPVGAGVRGVGPKEIRVGIELPDNAAASRAVGAAGPIVSNEQLRRMVLAVVEHINRRGGLAKRTIVPEIHFTDPNVGSLDSQNQEACTYFTEDREVFAVVFLANGSNVFADCLAAHKTVLIEEGAAWQKDQEDFERLRPYVYWATDLSLSRFGVYIDGLHQAGFFRPDAGKSKVTVGLLRYELPNHVRTRDRVLKPALRRYGLDIAEEFAFRPANTVQDFGVAAGEANSAVFRFSSSGVDRVIFLPSMRIIPFSFLTAAESQGYRPRYGLNSAEGPQFMIENSPARQLEGSLGVGWHVERDSPTYDFGDNEVWRACRQIASEAGLPQRSLFMCTPFLLLEAGLNRVAEVSAAGLRAAVDGLGTTRYSAHSFITRWGRGRYDGVASARLIAYDGACPCYRYTSSAFDIPQ